jgi:hypothetical protein
LYPADIGSVEKDPPVVEPVVILPFPVAAPSVSRSNMDLILGLHNRSSFSGSMQIEAYLCYILLG